MCGVASGIIVRAGICLRAIVARSNGMVWVGRYWNTLAGKLWAYKALESFVENVKSARQWAG